MTDDKVTITLANGDTMEVHPDAPVRLAGGYAPFLAKYVKAGEACDAVYEPTREHWTPYEPWMRDVLADGARVSWIDGNECRCDWESSWGEEDGDFDYMRLRIHPDDVPERPTEADPLVEAMRASFRDAYPRTDGDDAVWEYVARAARKHIEAERGEGGYNIHREAIEGLADLADMTRQRDALGRRADYYHDVAAKVKADRDEWREDAIRNGEDRNKWMAKYAEMRRERDELKARHKALRADVDEFQYKHREYPGTWELVDALARDTERGAS